MKRSGWLPPSCESRTGASHQRRGAPCQDSSGLWCFEDGSGEPIQVLVVSDGHGGSRYDRSAVGSLLACRVALEAMQRELAGMCLSQHPNPQEWQRWLAEVLPVRLLQRWRREVLRHAGSHPRSDGAPPSTLPYGATLGVLLLTPRWWGCTGLGDWDLVRIADDGTGELLNEEPDLSGGGEATFSLCMEGAERHFAARSALVAIPAEQAPFRLLLSSDGIRKSCGSDADFLTLARHLGDLAAAGSGDAAAASTAGRHLTEALDHISLQGSGDDVSVATARWGRLDASAEGHGLQPRGPLIVQPGQEPAPPPLAADAARQRPQGPMALASAHRHAAAGSGDQRRRHGSIPWLRACLAALALAAAGAAGAALFGMGLFTRRLSAPGGASPELLGVLKQQVDTLCRAQPPDPGPGEASTTAAGAATPGASSGAASKSLPAASDDRGGAASATLQASLLSAITDTLNQRRSSFRDLRRGAIRPEAFLARPAQDPTGALIAWSALQSSAARPALVPALQLCPELREALRQQWQRAHAPVAPGAVDQTGAPDSPNR